MLERNQKSKCNRRLHKKKILNKTIESILKNFLLGNNELMINYGMQYYILGNLEIPNLSSYIFL